MTAPESAPRREQIEALVRENSVMLENARQRCLHYHMLITAGELQTQINKNTAALSALAQPETLPADIEDALRLAEEFCSDPDQRAQVRVQLAMNGWGKLADMIDEAVKVSRALLKVCGRE